MYNICSPEVFAVFLCRVILGILFLFQGYEKLFTIGITKVTEIYRSELVKKGFPLSVVKPLLTLSSFIEFAGGFLLIIGLFKYYSLYLLGLNMIGASLAFSIMRPMWDLQHVFPRLALLVALLILPEAWDLISIDNFLIK